MKTLILKSSFLLLFLSYLSLNACFFKKKSEELLINGAGASFPYILYSRWLSEYRKIDPSVFINYQSIGSGGGIRQFLTGTLDFGGTDVPVPKEETANSQKEILHIPTALGAVAVTYNLPIGKGTSLHLDGWTLSQIFQGEIKLWNNPQIKKLNPDLPLPQQDIVVVYRADASGTTSFWTDYLAQSDKSFVQKIGKGKSVPWPVGVGGKGNEGIMGLVNKIEGAIAYIGASYAVSQKLPQAVIKNKSGQWVKPTLESIQWAAKQAMKSQKSHISSLINIEGKGAYPLSGFTYIIISKKMPKQKGEALLNFLKWALGPGQEFAEPLHFVSLPKTVAESALKTLSQVEFEQKQ